jgi:outer membrane protein assembly factor BamB
VHAQFGAGDWTTTGFDAQRSFWLRSDPKISLANMQKGGFGLVWKTDLNDGSSRRTFVTPPVLLDFYIGYRGFRSLGFTGTGANSVIAMDTDLGRLEWKADFKTPATPGNSPLCPGGMTSGVARPTNVAYPLVTAARGAGRGAPAKSGVGEPFEGAVTIKEIAGRRSSRPSDPPPKPAAGARRIPAPVSPFAPRIQWLYALASDGKLHRLYVSNGEEPNDAMSFLPANANAKGLIVVDELAYAATANGCGGVENAIWALDIPSSRVSKWKAPGNLAGAAGVALGPDGAVYATARNQLVALEERTLKLRGAYNIGQQEFTSSPIVFDFQGRDLIAATANDGKLHMLDAGAMERPIAITPAFSAPGFATGAIAAWRDGAGTRWLLVPAESGKGGAIVAWKIVDRNGAPVFERGWVSRDMITPLTPIVVNDVIFAVSSGDSGAAAVLYALEGASGREIWNSGHSLSGFVTTGGLAAGGSRVYVATHDGVQYVFGFPIEH